jgi:NADH-quinone oxidoreductase subunit C
MSEERQPLPIRLKARFGSKLTSINQALGQVTIECAAEHAPELARALRDEAGLQFEQMIDLCGVDYLGHGEDEWDTERATDEGYSRGVEGRTGPGRFKWAERRSDTREHRYAVVVHLLSVSNNQRLRLRYFASDDALPSVHTHTDEWPVANRFEREAFDMYGIVFEGHPDLRRILTDYGFVGHPFRKDFPLIGNVEVRYDPERSRVVYEPVSIEPRTLVPKVIRRDHRYDDVLREQGSFRDLPPKT